MLLFSQIIFMEQSKVEKGLYELAKYQKRSEADLRKLYPSLFPLIG